MVLYHYSVHYASIYAKDYRPAVELDWGYMGVHLFFMISGFVIFMTLERTREGRDFIISRFSRLYPAYWFAILVTTFVCLAYGLPGQLADPLRIAINFTMIQETVGVPHVDGVYWSLTYELIFYAWMFLFFKLRQLGRIQPLIAGWLLVALGAHFCEKYLGYFPWKITYFGLLQVAHLFSAGILFYLIHAGRATRLTYVLLPLCAINTVVYSTGPEQYLVKLSFFALFILIVTGKARFLMLKPLVFLGAISYSLYLLHQNVGYVAMDAMRRAGWNANIALVLTTAGAIVLAWLAMRYVEKPSMRAVRGWLGKPHESRAPAAAPAVES